MPPRRNQFIATVVRVSLLSRRPETLSSFSNDPIDNRRTFSPPPLPPPPSSPPLVTVSLAFFSPTCLRSYLTDRLLPSSLYSPVPSHCNHLSPCLSGTTRPGTLENDALRCRHLRRHCRACAAPQCIMENLVNGTSLFARAVVRPPAPLRRQIWNYLGQQITFCFEILVINRQGLFFKKDKCASLLSSHQPYISVVHLKTFLDAC